MRRWAWAVALAAVVGACGGDDDGGPTGDERISIEVAVPATIEGSLEVTVEEGDVGADGLSTISFGAVDTADGLVFVEIPAEVVRAAGLTREELVAGGAVRLNLDAPGAYPIPQAPSYQVSALEPVP